MVNHVENFAPHTADTTKPLRDLMKKETDWNWDEPQEKSLPNSEKAAEFNTSVCTLQSRQADQSLSRCIVIWIRWRTPPETRK